MNAPGSSLAMVWWEAALAFLYPPICQLCQIERATPREGFVCAVCRSGVRVVPEPRCSRCGLPFPGAFAQAFECSNCRGVDLAFSCARAAVIADGVVLEVIHRYKYQRAVWFEPFLAECLIQASADELKAGAWDCLVPVPLHPVREREREFNQAERLARRLARVTRIPIAPRWVERTEVTRTQTRLSRERRAENVGHAFRSRPGATCAGKRCVVIDDVLTTGATTHAVAQVLRRLGASEVMVWSVARAILKPDLIGA